ncbi:Cinnamoyl-CoA reductase-like SNL6 [Linum grandiflorum]
MWWWVAAAEDVEKLREVERRQNSNSNSRVVAVEAVMASLFEVERLKEAFTGCHGVFHTAAFADPAGLSGYTKSMGEIEVKAAENVVEACSTTPSVRSCVVTSSLLACIWRDSTLQDYPCVVNHKSWSHESFCRDKRLWYALGKVRAEKAAWSKSKEKGVKLATICPGLVTGPEFLARNPTSTVAYLKGR